MNKNDMRKSAWYADDARAILADLDVCMAGLWVKLFNRCLLSDKPGVLVCSMEHLAFIMGMKKEEMLTAMLQMAIRLRRIQTDHHGHSAQCTAENYMGTMWVSGHLAAWIDGVEVTEETARDLATKNTGWEAVRVECPRKMKDDLVCMKERGAWRVDKQNQRGKDRRLEENETQSETLLGDVHRGEGVDKGVDNSIVHRGEGVDKGVDNSTCPPPCPGTYPVPFSSTNIPLPPKPPAVQGELLEGLGARKGRTAPKPGGVRQKRLTAAECTPEMNRIGAWFGHAPGRGWTVEDREAWELVAKGMAQEGDLDALEWYYTEAAKRFGRRNYDAMSEHGFWPCRNVRSLLSKWRGQVDKALDRRQEEVQEKRRSACPV